MMYGQLLDWVGCLAAAAVQAFFIGDSLAGALAGLLAAGHLAACARHQLVSRPRVTL